MAFSFFFFSFFFPVIDADRYVAVVVVVVLQKYARCVGCDLQSPDGLVVDARGVGPETAGGDAVAEVAERRGEIVIVVAGVVIAAIPGEEGSAAVYNG